MIKWLSKFKIIRDTKGVAAVEFALIFPMMFFSMYIAGIDIVRMYNANLRLSVVARSMADLSTQVKTISNADMNKILQASALMFEPLDTDDLKVRLTGLSMLAADGAKPDKNRATVIWSDEINWNGGNGVTSGGLADKSLVRLPKQLVDQNFLVKAEVFYDVKLISSSLIGKPGASLSDEVYFKPRLGGKVCRADDC